MRIYFRRIIVYGKENVPAKGPLILASNHPSAFLEASILSIVMPRPVHFLVRGDMFHPRFKWLFKWTKQIPIYRKKDGISNLRKNASSFDYTYRILGEGEGVLIFPEAKTVLEKKMRPIQKGTAHLAFGTIPFLSGDEELNIQPVGVNFTEPRLPGTDVIVQFGKPFTAPKASRDDREAIDTFTERLSESMTPLIIQIDDAVEKNYDVLASVYLRLLFENNASNQAFADLQKIATVVNSEDTLGLIRLTNDFIEELESTKIREAAYFPDLIVLPRSGLFMMILFKIAWLVSGGWIWRLIRSTIFKKITTNTFQTPTSVGVAMVIYPLVFFILIIIFLILDISVAYAVIWLFIMWLGSLFRPPLHLIYALLTLKTEVKRNLKAKVISMRNMIGNL